MELELKNWSGSIALDVVRRIIRQGPEPGIQTEVATRCSEAIGLHLIMLILVAIETNLRGYYSCSLALFRQIEDALDCFAAVSLVPGAGEKWARGELKASDAARLWEHKLGEVVLPTGEKVVDYRKRLRNYFNKFAHCTPYLTDWNLYPELSTEDKEKIAVEPNREHTLTVHFRVNHEQKVLKFNARHIEAYLLSHILEFISVVEMAYEKFLTLNPDLKVELSDMRNRLKDLFEKEFGAVYLKDRPPELKQVVVWHPTNPNLVKLLPISFAGNDETDPTADNSG